MYHPSLGQWLQRDPAGYSDGLNLYQYAHARPPGATDPTGLSFIPILAPNAFSNPYNTITYSEPDWYSEEMKQYEEQKGLSEAERTQLLALSTSLNQGSPWNPVTGIELEEQTALWRKSLSEGFSQTVYCLPSSSWTSPPEPSPFEPGIIPQYLDYMGTPVVDSVADLMDQYRYGKGHPVILSDRILGMIQESVGHQEALGSLKSMLLNRVKQAMEVGELKKGEKDSGTGTFTHSHIVNTLGYGNWPHPTLAAIVNNHEEQFEGRFIWRKIGTVRDLYNLGTGMVEFGTYDVLEVRAWGKCTVKDTWQLKGWKNTIFNLIPGTNVPTSGMFHVQVDDTWYRRRG